MFNIGDYVRVQGLNELPSEIGIVISVVDYRRDCFLIRFPEYLGWCSLRDEIITKLTDAEALIYRLEE
jgi:hypothetical protein